ncbi:hypothetical protein BGZ92_010879, partial [Podila epicladia]
IKCVSDSKKGSYTFQAKSDGTTRTMTVKDYNSNQVCKVKSKGEHLLDLYLTTDSRDITVQFRDMIAFKKAFDRAGGYFLDYSSANNVCWAFEFEGRIYQWTAGNGQGIHAPPGSDVLLCHSASLGPGTKVAKLQSSHTGASDKLIVHNAAIANVIDKVGLQILLLASVLGLTEILNDRSRELIDFD